MEIKNCRKCGRMFNYLMGPQICDNCKKAAEEKFQEVKEYVRANKSAPIQEICRECDVEQKQVQQWIREERLVFSDDSPVMINCEICGKQIRTGRYCDSCKKDTANAVSAAGRRPGQMNPGANNARHQSGSRMHTFNDK